MLVVCVPLAVGVAVYLIVNELVRTGRAMRLRLDARAVVRPVAADKQDIKTALLRALSHWGNGHLAWAGQLGLHAVEKKLELLPAWPGRGAGQWLAIKEASVVVGCLVGWLLGLGLGWSLAFGAGAFFLPDLWLKEKLQKRQQSLLRELPEALDLLAACMEAGLGFEQALSVVMERGAQGYLTLEFQDMMRRIRIGQSRAEGLREMGRRVDHPSFSAFITAVLQAERMGVSVVKTLKQQASQMRFNYFQRIEKVALEAPVKLLFPLIAFIFPVVFMVLFGPIIIRFMQGF